METGEAQRKEWVAASVWAPFCSINISVTNAVDLTVVSSGMLAPTNQLPCFLAAAWMINRSVNTMILSHPIQHLRLFVEREWQSITTLQRYKWLTYELDNGASAIASNGKVRSLGLGDYPSALRQSFKRAAVDSGLRRSMLGLPYAASLSLLGKLRKWHISLMR